MRLRTAATALLLVACAPASTAFTSVDEAAVRDLEERYRAAWLADDPDGVMATLASDAVLMPAGLPPLMGHDAIRAYWWPADGSVTTIHDYELVVEEVEGSGDLAFVRGRGSLAFTYQDPAGEASSLSSESVHLSVARRDADGVWRIVRRAWSAVQ